MKTLFKITLAFAAVIILLVGAKIGYYEFTHKDKYMTVAPSVNSNNTVMPSQTKPSALTESDAKKSNSVNPPERFVIYSADDSTGSPVGSTSDKPKLENSVFIGDSVSLGFSRYCAKKGILSDTVFLTAGSYSVKHALSSDISEEKGYSHPIYKGKEQPIKQSIEQIQPKNVYICLGINDIAVSGVEGTVKNYCKLINSVWEAAPDANIYIVSTTFMADSAQKQNLNNLNLANLNHNMKLLCLQTDNLEYIDIMSGLQDKKFALDASYCSDEYIHQSDEAYAIWANALISDETDVSETTAQNQGG